MTIRVPIDFASATDEYELIPAGVYSAILEGMTYQEAQSEGKFPQLQVDYTLTEDGDFEGRKLSQWLSFSPKALLVPRFGMKAFFDAFEVDIDELEIDEETGVVVNPELSGAVVEVKIQVQPHYQDRNRKVNKIEDAPVVHSVPDAPKAKVKARVLPRGAKSEEVEEDEAPARKTGARTIR